MTKYIKVIISLFVLTFVLSGCLYPGDQRAEDHIPYQSAINTVQLAVDAFHKDTGVLPIKNSTEKTPIYQKYKIDFSKLVPKYMATLPVNAYENGGYFQYVIIHPEKKPTIKLIDVTLFNAVQDIQERVDVYRYQHGFSPINGIITTKRFKINYKDLGYKKPPYVKSPYSSKLLGFVMDENSKIYINYKPDLYAALKKSKEKFKPGQDIRKLLVDQNPILPIDSLPYTVKNNEPVFLVK